MLLEKKLITNSDTSGKPPLRSLPDFLCALGVPLHFKGGPCFTRNGRKRMLTKAKEFAGFESK